MAQYLARKNAGENGNLTKEKKGPFLSKKFKQAGILKDGKKVGLVSLLITCTLAIAQ